MKETWSLWDATKPINSNEKRNTVNKVYFKIFTTPENSLELFALSVVQDVLRCRIVDKTAGFKGAINCKYTLGKLACYWKLIFQTNIQHKTLQ